MKIEPYQEWFRMWLWPHLKACFMLFLKHRCQFWLNQVVRSCGTNTRTHYLDLFRTRFRVLRSLRVKNNSIHFKLWPSMYHGKTRLLILKIFWQRTHVRKGLNNFSRFIVEEEIYLFLKNNVYFTVVRPAMIYNRSSVHYRFCVTPYRLLNWVRVFSDT